MHNDIEELKTNIARMEAELRKMKETLERRERNWPATLEKGMLFRRATSGIFMLCRFGHGTDDLRLVGVAGDIGNRWCDSSCFNKREKEFTYIGMAKDKLRIID